MKDRPKDPGKAEEAKGFRVIDRRGEGRNEPAEGPAAAPPETPPSADAPPPGPAPGDPGAARQPGEPLPPISFATFILSLSSGALVQLGELPDPFTQKIEKNFTAAQQTIDILGLLEEKTKGNLTPDESGVLEEILYDLRVRFLRATGRF
jgi:hypothetical protein